MCSAVGSLLLWRNLLQNRAQLGKGAVSSTIDFDAKGYPWTFVTILRIRCSSKAPSCKLYSRKSASLVIVSHDAIHRHLSDFEWRLRRSVLVKSVILVIRIALREALIFQDISFASPLESNKKFMCSEAKCSVKSVSSSAKFTVQRYPINAWKRVAIAGPSKQHNRSIREQLSAEALRRNDKERIFALDKKERPKCYQVFGKLRSTTQHWTSKSVQSAIKPSKSWGQQLSTGQERRTLHWKV